MLGREKACSPVFIWRQAPLWLILSATIERMIQRSSTHPARWGKSSLTSAPALPYFWNSKGEESRLPVFVRSSLGFSKGRGFPLSRARRSLGSKVSTWEGPPDIKRKITLLARAGNIGG